MEIQDVKKIKDRNKKTIGISIKISKDVSEWMKENNLSPTAIFNKAIENLRKEK